MHVKIKVGESMRRSVYSITCIICKYRELYREKERERESEETATELLLVYGPNGSACMQLHWASVQLKLTSPAGCCIGAYKEHVPLQDIKTYTTTNKLTKLLQNYFLEKFRNRLLLSKNLNCHRLGDLQPKLA